MNKQWVKIDMKIPAKASFNKLLHSSDKCKINLGQRSLILSDVIKFDVNARLGSMKNECKFTYQEFRCWTIINLN
jgi:hypothetical protein